MKVIIVGGGIAGLYAAMRITDMYRDANVLVLEKESYIGGRIKTIKYDGVTMDAGAARFNDNHKWLFKLFHKLGFDKGKDMWPLTTSKIYMKDSKEYPLNTTTKIKDIIKLAEKTDPTYLKNVTLKMFMKEHMSDSLVDDLIYSFGYNTEFDLMNAYDAVKVFKTDFLDDEIQYYVLKNGMQEVINKMIKHLESTGRCTFKTGCQVSDVSKGNIHIMDEDTPLKCDLIMLCMTKKTMEALPGLRNNRSLQNTLRSLGNGELLRIFSKFPNEKNGLVWFHRLPRVTTNNFLRYIIPLNYETGAIMVSYTDGHYAREWNTLPNDKYTTSVITNNLRKLFPTKTISEPSWIKSFYWEEGTHCWLPGAKKYLNTAAKVTEYGYVVCGEVVSEHNQAWIEGALDSVEKALKSIKAYKSSIL